MAELTQKQADGYVIPLGPVNLVSVITDVGMVRCWAFDVGALNNFVYPAARVKPSIGSSIATIDDLLAGTVEEVNLGSREARAEEWDDRKGNARFVITVSFCPHPAFPLSNIVFFAS